jgi:hypothetical protein
MKLGKGKKTRKRRKRSTKNWPFDSSFFKTSKKKREFSSKTDDQISKILLHDSEKETFARQSVLSHREVSF